MSERPPKLFLSGIVEGFYGRSWPVESRLAYADYLVDAGLNTCLYCPKADPYLRKRWQEHWPAQEWKELRYTASHYRERGIQWGVGLSPFELYRRYGRAGQEQLRLKLSMLEELEAPLLAILFDDMPGDMDMLADRQAEIIADVARWSPTARILVCPTYYSFDPVLERHFGAMPEHYWSHLGAELPAAVDIFWTGNQVCSESINVSDLEAITAVLGREVILWDNYPVNDGAVRSNFLYTSALSGRSATLAPLLTGHLCNPMNQALMSLPALTGLSRLYGSSRGLDDESLQTLLGGQTWQRLQAHGPLFESEGLAGLGEERCLRMAAEYDALPGPAASEVAGWLRGEYRFDPACLTD